MPARPGGSGAPECPYVIVFDMEKILALRQTYESAVEVILDLLPPIKWSSRKETIKYFKEHLAIDLQSTKIAEIDSHLEGLDHDSERFYTIYGVSMYLKLRYTIANYLDCIIRHEKQGMIRLRFFNGHIRMPNRQPLTHNEEIKQCIMHTNYEGE